MVFLNRVVKIVHKIWKNEERKKRKKEIKKERKEEKRKDKKKETKRKKQRKKQRNKQSNKHTKKRKKERKERKKEPHSKRKKEYYMAHHFLMSTFTDRSERSQQNKLICCRPILVEQICGKPWGTKFPMANHLIQF